MNNTVNLLNGLEYLYPDNNMISQIKRTLHKFPESEPALIDAFSLGQLKSKLWLIDNLPNNLGLVFICAGWYGTLASLMFDRARDKFDKIRSFDLDESCAAVADTINRPWVIDGWQFKASTLDILEMGYPITYITYRANGSIAELTENPDTIINTSCEHISNFQLWYQQIPNNTLVVLQNNDFFDIKEHVNCVNNLHEFKKQTPMSTTLYEGVLNLEKYNRFMMIGYK